MENHLSSSLESKLALKKEAARRVALEDQVKLPLGYRTLFAGLKMNHPHHVALAHILIFTLRRVLYSVVIIYMAREGLVLWGIFLLMTTCVAMGVLLVMEAQW